MIEKIGHVKNPLTVIAIFAALTEVGGTAVLPFIDIGIQQIYIWFLMVFPVFLVAVFFLVLYKKHHVLYAPTDFKDDQTFKELFESASSSAKVAKIKSEQEEPVPETPTEAPLERTPIANTSAVPVISASETLRRSFQGNGLLAEELVVAKLSKDLGLKFLRNRSVKGQKGVVFDAVSTGSDNAVIAEVRFTRAGVIPEAAVLKPFDQVRQFAETLPSDLKNKLEFIYSIATDTDDNLRFSKVERLVEMIRTNARAYQFQTTVHLFKMQDLEREFSVQ